MERSAIPAARDYALGFAVLIPAYGAAFVGRPVAAGGHGPPYDSGWISNRHKL